MSIEISNCRTGTQGWRAKGELDLDKGTLAGQREYPETASLRTRKNTTRAESITANRLRGCGKGLKRFTPSLCERSCAS